MSASPGTRSLPAASITLVVAVLGWGAPAHAAGPARHSTLPFASPDGRRIVFTRDRDGGAADLCVADARTGRTVVVTHDTSGSVIGGWSDGGRTVTWTTRTGEATDLWRARPNGSLPIATSRCG